MHEKTSDFLTALGIAGTEHDPLLYAVVSNIEYRVLNETNTALPMTEELESIAVYLAVGEYLQCKKVCGQLTGIDLTPQVKQLQEGDTSIQYAIGTGNLTPEQRLEQMVDWFQKRGRELYKFRKLVW
ncbi:MAG: hypothetical protein KHY77_11150 [Butyricicoccus pullicaecorum]|nr:hypothetical protein [Butyricicoccus pullicaecorum]